MTLEELYGSIGGDLDQALRVLRVEKLVDKHIRRFVQNGVMDAVLEAGETLDPTRMFETAHAAKGVCGNLGLTEMYGLMSELSEEFRPGSARQLSDDAVKEKLGEVRALYGRMTDGIRAYEEA